MWTLINCGHVVELTEHSHIFIKMIDVQDCKSLVKHTLPVITPPRGRLDITGEHAYIHQLALRDEILTSPPPSMSCVDSPAPAIPVTPHPQLNTRSVTTVRKKRPRSAEVVEILGTDSNSDSPVIVSAASHQWQLKRLASKLKLKVPMPMKTWPSDFSVAEISNGFHDIEALAAQQNYMVKMAFEEVFKVPYVNSTYYGHLQRWKCATQDGCNTAHGSWSDFMKTTRAPDADIKAACKQVKCRNVNLVSAPTSELATSSIGSGDRM